MQRAVVTEGWFFRNVPCWCWSLVTTVVVLLPRLLIAAPSPDSIPHTFPAVLTLQDGKLTAQIASLSLHQVMEEISRLSGAEVLWLGQEEEEQISAEFSAIPFAEALRRLLGERNFMLFYVGAGQKTRLAQIWISPRISTATVTATASLFPQRPLQAILLLPICSRPSCMDLTLPLVPKQYNASRDIRKIRESNASFLRSPETISIRACSKLLPASSRLCAETSSQNDDKL
jgi:hypothetical protein